MNRQQRIVALARRQVVDDLADRHRHRVGGELGHHQAAGEVRRVTDQFPDFIGFLVVELRDDRFGIVGVEFREYVDAVITREFFYDRRRILRGHLLHQVGDVAVRQVLDDRGRPRRRQQRQQGALLFGFQLEYRVQQFGRLQLVEHGFDVGRRSRVGQHGAYGLRRMRLL